MIQLQLLQEQHGLFTATPGGLVIDSLTGIIDLDSSTAGTYTVQYIMIQSMCRHSFGDYNC